MELRQLRYFMAVAEEKHFTRAAAKLYISQPALSQQMKLLEAELGAPLFDRSGRRVQMTPAGEILFHHARRVVQELDEAQTALDELAGLQRGSLRVGVVQTVNAYLMPDVVAAFTSAYPAVKLQVEELASGEIEQRVLEGMLQLGIGFVPTSTEGVESQQLFQEELVLVVARHHPLAGRAQLAVRDLERQPLILLSRAFCTRRLWDACAGEAGIQPPVRVEMNTISSLLAAVRSMQVATVLPALALTGTPNLVGVPLVEPTPRRTVGMFFRRSGYRCTATRAFAEIVRQQLTGHSGAGS